MVDTHDVVLAAHVVAGSLALILGAVGLSAERPPVYLSRAGSVYPWAVLGVALSAGGLVLFDWSALWWLSLLAALSYGLALLGYLAPRRHWRGWVRAYAHGQGGSYTALVTALLVVSLDGPAMIAAWVLPTLVGVALIERRVARIGSAARTPGPNSLACQQPKDVTAIKAASKSIEREEA